MEGWLNGAVSAVADGEQRLQDSRVQVGMVLYRLRVDVGDGPYGEACDRIAREAGVTVRTLSTWRGLAEKHLQLPPPDDRTEKRRKRAEEERAKKAAEKAEMERLAELAKLTQEEPLPELPGGSSDTIPPPVDSTSTDPGESDERSGGIAEPRTQEDYRRLLALTRTAGPENLRTSVESKHIAQTMETLADALDAETLGALVLKWLHAAPATKLFLHVFNEREAEILVVEKTKLKPFANRMRKWADGMDPPKVPEKVEEPKRSSSFSGAAQRDVKSNLKGGKK